MSESQGTGDGSIRRGGSGADPSAAGTGVGASRTGAFHAVTPPGAGHARMRALCARLRATRRLSARLIATRRRRVLLGAVASVLTAIVLFPPAWVVYHVYFDRTGLPDVEAFVRFEPPTTGTVLDAQGRVLIELAREYRRVVTYDQVPPIVRQAITAAEDKRFFSHAGVDYRALPRVIQKTAVRSIGEWWKGGHGVRLLLPQGGSTLTQQLVRGYFLQDLTSRSAEHAMFHAGVAPARVLSTFLGASATNKLLRKMEEVRLSLWLEEAMRQRFGSQARAKQEIFARYASFIYLGNGRYGFAAASEYYFGRPLSAYTEADAGTAAVLAAISKSPRDYAPAAGNRRLRARRNQILALMARNGDIPASLAARCQGEPIIVARRSTLKTHAPAAIEHVLDELTTRSGNRTAIEDLFQGRIVVRATVDARVQAIVNDALEHGLSLYEKRHPAARGLIQGSVVVLRNADAAILAEAGGRQTYGDHATRYSDYNRVTGSLRQPGSAMKPLVYLAAFESGLGLDSTVPDEPIEVPLGDGGVKWIANYDHQFKGPIPVRQALAESRNAVAVWITREIGVGAVIRIAHQMGIRSPLQPYLSTALGASEVRLLELADAYRAIASGLLAEPYIVDRVTDVSGDELYVAPRAASPIRFKAALRNIQEGLRGVVRLPKGTAHSLAARDFPVPVMGKTGTTSDFRDALFVGSTYGAEGITVAVRIGFDDNRPLGARETGGLTALPVFREVMRRVYQAQLIGPTPRFPREIEAGIDQYLAAQAALVALRTDRPAIGQAAVHANPITSTEFRRHP